MEITENSSKSFAYRLKFGGGNDDQQFRNNFIETKKMSLLRCQTMHLSKIKRYSRKCMAA